MDSRKLCLSWLIIFMSNVWETISWNCFQLVIQREKGSSFLLTLFFEFGISSLRDAIVLSFFQQVQREKKSNKSPNLTEFMGHFL